MRALLAAPLLAGCLLAADAQVSVPVIGHIFDADSKSVKAILGIPGSARFGEKMSFGDLQVARAWVGPESSVALAAGSDGKLYRLDLAALTVGEIDGSASNTAPEDVIWSPSASSAALRYGDGRIRVVRDLQSGQASVEAKLAAETTLIAVSDDGSFLMIIRNASGSTLVALSSAGEERILLAAPGINGAAFFHRSGDAVVSDSVEGKLYLLRDSGELSVLAHSPEPSALAVAPDNSQVFVVSKSRASITAVRIADGVSASFACSCAPDRIERLGSGLFRISGSGGELTWLFNPDNAITPLTFVPKPVNGNE